jgi:glutamate carboxypeptidase
MPLSAIEQRLVDATARRRGELFDDLALHVGIPTGSGHAAALDETRERLVSRLLKLGAGLEIVPGDARPAWIGGPTLEQRGEDDRPLPTVIVRSKAWASARTRGRTRVVVAGHLDTVHPVDGPFRSLSIAPGGKTATGPGCVDMKGGLVITMAAIEALQECGVDVPWAVVLNSDEETGSYYSDRALRMIAREADVAIAVEPAMADGGLAVQRGGSGQFLLESFGKAAHVGRDFFKGSSAVTTLSRAIGAIAEFPDQARGLVANIGPLEGGVAPNVVADAARAWGNVRFEDAAGEAHMRARLQSLEHGGDAPGQPGLRVQTSFNRPAKTVTPGTQALADLARRTAEDLGQKLPFGKTGGVCDGNILQDAIPITPEKPMGLPTIDTLGVRGGGLHTPEEWIDLSSLVERCQLLALVMARAGDGALQTSR